jgi:regulator of replication initiation timing
MRAEHEHVSTQAKLTSCALSLSCPCRRHSLNGMNPSVVLSGLAREELTLKQLKNFFMEEMERVQLEAALLKRQLDELQSGSTTAGGEEEKLGAAEQGLADEAQSDQLRMLLEDGLAEAEENEAREEETNTDAAASSTTGTATTIPGTHGQGFL